MLKISLSLSHTHTHTVSDDDVMMTMIDRKIKKKLKRKMTLAHKIISRIDPKWIDFCFDTISMCFDIFMKILSPCLIVLACGLIAYVCRLGFFVLLPLRAVRFAFHFFLSKITYDEYNDNSPNRSHFGGVYIGL